MFLTENGTEFKNKEMQSFLNEAGIEHVITPTYHPQANPVERINRTVKTKIRGYLSNIHKDWDSK